MPAPVISWFDPTNTSQQTSWPVGTVDAGTVSAATDFLIWNNRGGAAAVSDATACAITTKDASGGNTGVVVTGLWAEVEDVKNSETAFTPVGGTTTHAVGNGTTAGVVSGAINDGTVVNSTLEFGHISIHLNVPGTATAGNLSWLLRMQYQYV